MSEQTEHLSTDPDDLADDDADTLRPAADSDDFDFQREDTEVIPRVRFFSTPPPRPKTSHTEACGGGVNLKNPRNIPPSGVPLFDEDGALIPLRTNEQVATAIEGRVATETPPRHRAKLQQP